MPGHSQVSQVDAEAVDPRPGRLPSQRVFFYPTLVDQGERGCLCAQDHLPSSARGADSRHTVLLAALDAPRPDAPIPGWRLGPPQRPQQAASAASSFPSLAIPALPLASHPLVRRMPNGPDWQCCAAGDNPRQSPSGLSLVVVVRGTQGGSAPFSARPRQSTLNATLPPALRSVQLLDRIAPSKQRWGAGCLSVLHFVETIVVKAGTTVL